MLNVKDRVRRVITHASGHRPALLAGAVVVGAYLPAVLGTYGISDDYIDLTISTIDNTSLPRLTLGGGRPVSGLIQEFALSLATDVSSLRWLRLVGLLGVAATAIVASIAVGWFTESSALRWAGGVFVGAVPAHQVTSAWAVLFPISWGLAIALAAGLALRYVDAGSWHSKQLRLAAIGVGVVTVFGLANYQPSAVGLAPGLAVALIADGSTVEKARRFTSAALGAVCGSILYLAVSRGLSSWQNVAVDTRSTLELPGASKLEWFARNALGRSLDVWSFQPRPMVAFAVAVLIVGGALAMAAPLRERLLGVALLGGAVIASYAPTLAVVDRWPSARSRIALDVCIALFAAIATAALASRLKNSIANRGGSFVIVSVALASIAFASWRVDAYWVTPQASEYQIMRDEIRLLDISSTDDVLIIRADWTYSFAPTSDLDEFGAVSMGNSWGPVGLLQIELIRSGRPMPKSITVVGGNEARPAADVVLDIPAIYRRAHP